LDVKNFFQEYEQGVKHNIVDHYIEGEKYDSFFPVPPILDSINLLLSDERTKKSRRSIVISAKDAYTSSHVDSYGYGGWMYLYHGEKVWEILDCLYAVPLLDLIHKKFYDPIETPCDPSYQPIVDNIPFWRGTLHAGELMILPIAYVHRVKTLKESVGFGGSLLYQGFLRNSVKAWLYERSLSIVGDMDFKDVLMSIQKTNSFNQELKEEIISSIALIEDFEKTVMN